MSGKKKKCVKVEGQKVEDEKVVLECPKIPIPFQDRIAFDLESKDVYIRAKAVCENSCAVKTSLDLFKSCERRVYNKRDYTLETCEQELVDLLESIDKCIVKNKDFLKLV